MNNNFHSTVNNNRIQNKNRFEKGKIIPVLSKIQMLKAKAMTIYRHVTLKKAIIIGFEEQTM